MNGQRPKHLVIIGGGITGLSAAYQFMKRCQGQDPAVQCTVLEQSPRFGGKILTHRENGFVMEGGPDSMLARKPSGIQLIRELGLESEVVGTNNNPAAQKTFILFRGRLEPIPPGTNMGIPTQLAPFASTRLLSLAGKLRALLDLVIPARRDVTDESLGGFLRRRLGNELVNRLIEPLLAGIYAGSVDELSLQATFPQFQRMEREHRSLIRGSLGNRRPQTTDPRTHSSASGSDAQGGRTGESNSSGATRSAFVTLRGGLQVLIDRLCDELRDTVDLRVNTTVDRILRTEGGYEVVVKGLNGDGTIHADAVLVTTPAFAAADLLEPLMPQAQLLRQIRYVSTATVILGFRAEDLHGLHGSGFVIPQSEGRAITACTWVTGKWPHTTPDGHIMVRCYVGRDGQTEGLALSDEDLVTLVRKELQDVLGIQVAPEFTKVTRWLDAMPQYRVNHLQRLAEVERAVAESLPGVRLAGGGYRGVGIPDCIAHGRDAADNAFQFLTQAAAR